MLIFPMTFTLSTQRSIVGCWNKGIDANEMIGAILFFSALTVPVGNCYTFLFEDKTEPTILHHKILRVHCLFTTANSGIYYKELKDF